MVLTGFSAIGRQPLDPCARRADAVAASSALWLTAGFTVGTTPPDRYPFAGEAVTGQGGDMMDMPRIGLHPP